MADALRDKLPQKDEDQEAQPKRQRKLARANYLYGSSYRSAEDAEYEAGKKQHEAYKLRSALKKIEEASVIHAAGFEKAIYGQLERGELEAFQASLDAVQRQELDRREHDFRRELFALCQRHKHGNVQCDKATQTELGVTTWRQSEV